MERFIKLIPEWDQLAIGLDVIVIDSSRRCMGWFKRGLVAVCAWERELIWEDTYDDFFEDHRQIFDKLGVPYHFNGDEDALKQRNRVRKRFGSTEDYTWTVEWTHNLARAFLLTHVFIHELGHHHDCMTTKLQLDACRGETYAENYAREREDEIIESYFNEFGF